MPARSRLSRLGQNRGALGGSGGQRQRAGGDFRRRRGSRPRPIGPPARCSVSTWTGRAPWSGARRKGPSGARVLAPEPWPAGFPRALGQLGPAKLELAVAERVLKAPRFRRQPGWVTFTGEPDQGAAAGLHQVGVRLRRSCGPDAAPGLRAQERAAVPGLDPGLPHCLEPTGLSRRGGISESKPRLLFQIGVHALAGSHRADAGYIEARMDKQGKRRLTVWPAVPQPAAPPPARRPGRRARHRGRPRPVAAQRAGCHIQPGRSSARCMVGHERNQALTILVRADAQRLGAEPAGARQAPAFWAKTASEHAHGRLAEPGPDLIRDIKDNHSSHQRLHCLLLAGNTGRGHQRQLRGCGEPHRHLHCGSSPEVPASFPGHAGPLVIAWEGTRRRGSPRSRTSPTVPAW